MKRFTLILTLFLMAAMPMMAERVTPETARKVATTFLNNNGAKVAQLTDLSKAAGFPNLYIFNANPGFVVMSADGCVKPILGYSLTNVFVVEGMPENIKGWLQDYSDEIQYAIDNQMRAEAETAKLWKDLADGNSKAGRRSIVVNALIETRWDQIQYYNLYCPAVADGPAARAYTGCVATAMAQIMRYWKKPAHGISSHSYTWSAQTLSADFGATTYDWNNMNNYYKSYYDEEGNPHILDNPSSTEIEAVSLLMYHCGVSVNMDYGGNSTGGSSASTAMVAEALKLYFNYSPDIVYRSKSSYSDDVWKTNVKAELDAARPLQYRGSSRGGHSFICDGYDSSDNFHFNWGWAGWCDGFYSLSNLTTTDPGSGGGNGNYTSNQGAIFGIQPVECSAADPTNLTYTQSGRNITLNWDAASGAASYNVYCDDNLIGNPTTTSFATTTPFGTHKYYVRSVDASSKLSLSSNTVTITIEEVYDLRMTLSGSDASLSWTAPTWCYSETPSATLTYGEDNVYYSWTSVYYGHRYLASNLSAYAGKKVYQVETYIQYPGTYSIYVFNKTNSNQPDPNYLAYSKEGINISYANADKWNKFDIETPVAINGSEDLWVVFKQEGTGQSYPTPSFNLDSHNINAFYAGNSPTNLYDNNSSYNCAWFIRAHLTDGTYTYHLYDNGVSVADNIDATSYVVSSPANNTAHQYTVKTKYYGGESAASNTAGLTLGETTLASLELTANDKLILTEGSQLTVTGTISNANAANLVIEDGAQLVHNGGDVEATIQKNISAWSAKGGAGWHLIASPVDEVNIASTLATGTYDLYGYHEPTHHWLNYKKAEHASFFDDLKLRRGKGYLYAHEDAKVVSFAGSMKETDVNVAVPLSWESSNETLKGWNLVGNPYSCNAYSNVAYYVMNAAGNGFESKTVNDAIPPCTGIFVRATGGGQSVTFSTTAPSSSANNGYLNIALDETNTRGSIRQDNAIVSFNEGEELSKFVFNEENAEVYFTQSNEDYAIAYSDKQGLMSLNFKARHDGTYTLSFTADVISSEAKKSPLNEMFSYLHLIDKRTDSDIDLLAMPSYTFEAKTSDNASRFTLVFDESGIASVSAEPFAYVSNGNIIINAATDKATLQMIDVTGRIVVSCTGDAIDHVSTSGMTPGVYVLRLVRGENIKTQKIVIE